MGRRIRLTLLIAAVVGTGVIVGRSTAPASLSATTRQAEIDAGIDRIIPELKFDATPCGEVFNRLREQTGANIAVNWPRLEAIGVRRAAPVTLTLKGLPLGRVLELVCAQLDPVGAVPVGHHVDRGVIVVSVGSDLAETSVVRIYDVRDLVKAHVDEELRIERLEAPVTQPAGGGSTLFSPLGAHGEAIIGLVELIQETVTPLHWREAGGNIGSIRVFGGRLIIMGTPEMHVKVAELLALVRNDVGEVRVR